MYTFSRMKHNHEEGSVGENLREERFNQLIRFENFIAEPNSITNKSVCKPITVHELYEEILFIIFNHNEADSNENPETFVEYLREVFGVSKQKHLELLKRAQSKQSPEKTLSIEVDRAENLYSMDANGMSDPFVTIYIESNFTKRYNTAVIPSTLNPSWKEHFSIPIQRNPATEILTVEVWDFDAAESVGEKINKLNEVKGIGGFKKLVKEIVLTASTGKHDNELIGRTNIPLKSIPAIGEKSWYTLKRSSKSRSRGSILLHLYISIAKHKVIAINEHRNLIRIFLLHELKLNNTKPYIWCGKFNSKAYNIIRRHGIQSNLSDTECDLCQWDVFTKEHEKHFLSLNIFNSLLRKLMPIIKEMKENDELVPSNLFWEGVKRILPSCFVIVRSIRSEKFEETYGHNNLISALEIIKEAKAATLLEDFDLFPQKIYGWLNKTEKNLKFDADFVLKRTVELSTLQFFNELYEKGSGSTENTLQHLIVVMRSILHDLHRAVEFHDKYFHMRSNFKYAALLYTVFQENVADKFFPQIVDSCNNLKQLNVLEEEMSTVKDFKNGTLLFDLYLALKRFSNLGSALFTPVNDLFNKRFYECFYPAVANWLNISAIKTITSIEKAIAMDIFLPHNNVMKYTSSALDTLSLFYQIKYFWEQLDWPHIEESFLFVEKIVNDVCRFCAFYGNTLSLHVNKLTENECSKHNSRETKDCCYAINDISFIKDGLPLFVKELKIEDILKELAALRSTMESERCSDTINNIICNTVDILESQMFELIQAVSRTLLPIVINIFEEGSGMQYKGSDRLDLLLTHFQKSVGIIQTELQEDCLNMLTGIVYGDLYLLMYEFIRKESDKYRQPSFFENVHKILSIILKILNPENNTNNSNDLNKICDILKQHAMNTESIIHQHYEAQLQKQNLNSQNEHGQISIKAKLSNDTLHVRILNAYQLSPMDSESSCNSYVKICFSPEEHFSYVQNLRTSVQYKTRCPLYDEKFAIKLSSKLCQKKSNILVLFVKNRHFLGLSKHYIAECYISFGDIEKADDKQIRMNLQKPEYSDTGIIHILARRTGDRKAIDFLRKMRQRASKQE